MKLDYFADSTATLIAAGQQFFREELALTLRTDSQRPLPPAPIFPEPVAALADALTLLAPDGLFFLGTIDEQVVQPASAQGDLFGGPRVPTLDESIARYGQATGPRRGILVFGLELTAAPTRTQLAAFSRALNRRSKEAPVMVVVRYPNPDFDAAAGPEDVAANQFLVSLATSERSAYRRGEQTGEKVGRVALLRDMRPLNTHEGHRRILQRLRLSRTGPAAVRSFSDLYVQWKRVFDVSVLNREFYKDLTGWYDAAKVDLKLPFKLDHETADNNKKSFLIRLLSRTLFAWFLKEKGLIPRQLLELEDHLGNQYELLRDHSSADFAASNSYYRGVLQNVFFHALNQESKSAATDFTCVQYLAPSFDFALLSQIPYLNGGIFDELPEDNCQATIEDTVLGIPNTLFYGFPAQGKKPAREGLNQLLNRYAFTIEENTPAEEVIALDPELLGLVFESLLAELDPDLKTEVRNSIRRLTGSFYTPRKVIQEMVNESLFLYLNKYFRTQGSTAVAGQLCPTYSPRLHALLYKDKVDPADTAFCRAVVEALDQLKVLDPACGSGAFPMGMLQRVVQLLQLLDPGNEYWLQSQLSRIPDLALRQLAEQELRGQYDNYARKLGIIKNCIYGLDIQPLAVQITKLRFFITLLIDQKLDEAAPNRGISPMPNLETKIVCANSLQDVSSSGFLFHEDVADRLEAAHAAYYQPHLKRAAKDRISAQIVDILATAFPNFARQVTGGGSEVDVRNRALIQAWFEHATVAAPFFNLNAFFPELRRTGGFDVVLGNPPYGGNPITRELKERLALGSTDPYGAFTARFLGDGNSPTPLRAGGVLAFIISDTFMTIGSHLALRRQLMHHYVHKMIRLHPDTFGATVNTVILLAERNQYGNVPVAQKKIPASHICQLVDMTRISIHQQHEQFLELLHKTEGFDTAARPAAEATPDFAIYHYPQQLIRQNSNLPFFVASPKLFGLTTDEVPNQRKAWVTISGNRVETRETVLNGATATLFKLKQVAIVPQGISTGQNKYYVRRNEAGEGYEAVDPSLILTAEDIVGLTEDEQQNGVNPKKYQGRYYLPFDKGAESDTDEGYMPNYWVYSDYYINWSRASLKRMRTLTISERKKLEGKINDIKVGDERKIAAALRNSANWFKKSIVFSPTGQYSPTFRYGQGTIGQNTSSGIICEALSVELLLGILVSKPCLYFFKNMYNHTVHTQEGDLSEFSIPILTKADTKRIEKLVGSIAKKQKTDPRYDYAQNEQLEIDQLVYAAYGLNAADIAEVEHWYARRYPRLVRPAAAPAPVPA